MNKKNAQNCWEFMNCQNEIKEKCEAYKRDLGKECWLVAENEITECNGYNKQYCCSICPWFIKNAGPSC